MLIKHGWKAIAVLLLLYSIVAGFLMDVPRLPILNESIRNLYFHVPMWFGMIFLLGWSCINAIRYLRNGNIKYDELSAESTNVATLFGIAGLITGMIWARYTWGDYWSGDPKQNAAAIGLLIYFAYLVLRGSITDERQKAKISAVYNIFAFAVFIPLIFVLPRLTDSLHPGNGGNPGFNAYDLDNRMRLVFYPAILGWTMLGFWMTYVRVRIDRMKSNLLILLNE